MGVSRMTGTAWHVEILSSGEKKRRKNGCRYYEKKRNFCRLKLEQCWGTHYCTDYELDKQRNNKSTSNNEKKNSPKANKNIKTSISKEIPKTRGFDGSKLVYIKDIVLDNNEGCPEQIEKLIEFYKKNKCFPAPAYLYGINDNKYLIVHNEDIILAAKELNIPTVYCKYLDKKQAIKDNSLREVGREIIHKNYGKGQVVCSTENNITIRFENGEIDEFGLDFLINNGLITN